MQGSAEVDRAQGANRGGPDRPRGNTPEPHRNPTSPGDGGCIEGSRSYGIGLARALAAAGLPMIECEQPNRRQRRGKGKSDPIDAHLAVLAALRLDTARLPVPRADGDRGALRILLVSRQGITVARTAQAGRLRALLLSGDDTDRRAARTALTPTALAALAGRELPADARREQAVRRAEIRRLALALTQARCQLQDNRAQLLAIVEDIAPGLTSRYGVGPVSEAQAIVSFSHPGRCRSEAAFAALGGTSPCGLTEPSQRAAAEGNRGGRFSPGTLRPPHREGSQSWPSLLR